MLTAVLSASFLQNKFCYFERKTIRSEHWKENHAGSNEEKKKVSTIAVYSCGIFWEAVEFRESVCFHS